MELVHQFKDVGPSGEVRAILNVERLWDGVYYLERMTPSRNLGDASPVIWSALLDQAIDFGQSLQAKQFQLRTIGSQDPEELIGWMSEAGFVKKHDRIEFRAPIDQLPSDEKSPIGWRAMESLTSGPDCVHLGKVEGQVMSVVIAQVNPKTGWSRITYMGMLPEFRGQGLGKWVHRHGFKMMREQGGTLYQGGTVSTNERMLKLFLENGCKEYRRMHEWTYKF